MARTYHAVEETYQELFPTSHASSIDYMSRQIAAVERGFYSYSEERAFRQEYGDVLNASIVSETLREMFPNIDLGPKTLVELYDRLGDFLVTGEDAITGEMRHELVAFFVEQGYSETEAVDQMREILGTSE